MAIHNRAGQPAQQSDLINVAQLTAQYYVLKPEAGNAEHAVNSVLPVTVAVQRATALTSRTFWRSLRQLLKNVRKTASLALAMWVKILTPCPNLHLFPFWKCWQRTA